MNLRLIKGDTQPEQAPDTVKRRKQIARIRTYSRAFFQPTVFGPRMTFALMAGIATGGLTIWGVGTGWPSTLAACAAFAAVLRYGSAAKTWGARMDTCLADYDPIDKVAYRQLQTTTEAEGLSPWALDEWMSREYEALDAADGIQPRSTRRGRFLRKKV